jgi:hypothetical protein
MRDETTFDVQELIGEVAKRHKIALQPDEPYFIMLTLSELVLSRYIGGVSRLLEAANEQARADRAKAMQTATAIGERGITSAADYAVKIIRSSTDELASVLKEAAAKERAKIELLARDARWLLWAGIILCAGVFSIVAAIVTGIFRLL